MSRLDDDFLVFENDVGGAVFSMICKKYNFSNTVLVATFLA
jgi:hypothetical protein